MNQAAQAAVGSLLLVVEKSQSRVGVLSLRLIAVQIPNEIATNRRIPLERHTQGPRLIR